MNDCCTPKGYRQIFSEKNADQSGNEFPPCRQVVTQCPGEQRSDELP